MSTAIITWVTDPADGGGGTAVRIKIDARVSVASKRGGLPLDTDEPGRVQLFGGAGG